jgi:hypothetical protein
MSTVYAILSLTLVVGCCLLSVRSHGPWILDKWSLLWMVAAGAIVVVHGLFLGIRGLPLVQAGAILATYLGAFLWRLPKKVQ